MRRLPLLFVAVLALAACNANKKENLEAPAELLEFTPTAQVSRLWERDLGKGERSLGLRLSPAVADGRVFALDPKGRLHAFDATSGSQAWEIKEGLRFSGGPGVGEGTLGVGTLVGDVIAYSPDSGTERWRARVSSEVIAAPAVSRGIVVVRSIDGRAFGFNLTDGERRWVYDRGIPALTLRGNSAPAVGNGLAVLGYDSGVIVALRIEDGTPAWERQVAVGEGRTELDRMVDIDGTMVIDGDSLFAATYNGEAVALSLNGGQSIWNRELSSYAGVALAGERVVVGDRDGTLWMLDRSTGAALWKQEALAYRWLTTPAIQGDYAVVGDLEGYLHWFALEEGKPAARMRLSRQALLGEPKVVDGVLFVQSSKGKLAAYRIN